MFNQNVHYYGEDRTLSRYVSSPDRLIRTINEQFGVVPDGLDTPIQDDLISVLDQLFHIAGELIAVLIQTCTFSDSVMILPPFLHLSVVLPALSARNFLDPHSAIHR